MATASELKALKADLPLTLFLIHDVGSQTETDHRLQVRETLRHLLTRQRLSAPEDLLNLQNSPPSHPELALSLSHSHTSSAVAWMPLPWRLGVDIEAIERVHIPVIHRIATAEEVSLAPDPRYLWMAKEAALKCLYPDVNVLSSVKIVNWVKQSETTWTFDVEPQITTEGYGEFHLILGHALAFFTVPS